MVEGCGEGGLIVALLLGLGLTISDPSVAAAGGFKGRKFYLTSQDTFEANAALMACVAKYHMASIWEILDLTNLSYALELGATIVTTFGDMGSGPPSNIAGWVRTGAGSGGGVVPGSGNCDVWTSNSPGISGTRVFLGNDWEAAPTLITPWVAQTIACNAQLRVWCVADK